MMSGKLRVGKDCYTYYNTATGSSKYATPTWTEAENVRDESLDLAKSKAEFSSRLSKFKRKKGALIEVPGSITIEYRKGDAFMDVLFDSFINNTPIDFAFMFDPLPPAAGETAEGIRCHMEVFDFPVGRALEEGVSIEVGIEMTEGLLDNGNLADMVWYEVSTPSP